MGAPLPRPPRPSPRARRAHTGFMPASSMRTVRKNMPDRWLETGGRGEQRRGAAAAGGTRALAAHAHARAHLVTSPASVASSWSPLRPTDTCEGARAPVCGTCRPPPGPLCCLLSPPPPPAPHQERVDVHRRVHRDPAPKVVVKLGLAQAAGRVVGQQLAEALRVGGGGAAAGRRSLCVATLEGPARPPPRATGRTWMPMAWPGQGEGQRLLLPPGMGGRSNRGHSWCGPRVGGVNPCSSRVSSSGSAAAGEGCRAPHMARQRCGSRARRTQRALMPTRNACNCRAPASWGGGERGSRKEGGEGGGQRRTGRGRARSAYKAAERGEGRAAAVGRAHWGWGKECWPGGQRRAHAQSSGVPGRPAAGLVGRLPASEGSSERLRMRIPPSPAGTPPRAPLGPAPEAWLCGL